jgi:hypothetical protein
LPALELCSGAVEKSAVLPQFKRFILAGFGLFAFVFAITNESSYDFPFSTIAHDLPESTCCYPSVLLA